MICCDFSGTNRELQTERTRQWRHMDEGAELPSVNNSAPIVRGNEQLACTQLQHCPPHRIISSPLLSLTLSSSVSHPLLFLSLPAHKTPRRFHAVPACQPYQKVQVVLVTFHHRSAETNLPLKQKYGNPKDQSSTLWGRTFYITGHVWSSRPQRICWKLTPSQLPW